MSNKGIGYVHYLLSDEKVQVNWYDKDQGLLGIKFHQGKTVPRLYKVVTEAEVDFRYGSIEPLPEDEVLHKDVRKESYESLKEKLNKVRKERKVLSKNKRKKSRKKTSPKKMLKNISQEEKERILEILQGDE